MDNFVQVTQPQVITGSLAARIMVPRLEARVAELEAELKAAIGRCNLCDERMYDENLDSYCSGCKRARGLLAMSAN